MALAVPNQSLEQRFSALKVANDVRFGRKAIKDDLHQLGYTDARCRVADLIEHPPAILLTMKVETLLLALPRFGDRKVGKLMFAHEISSRKRIGGLSERQRKELAYVLRTCKLEEDFRRRVSTQMRLRSEGVR